MNLRQLDMNLLLVLKVLLEECNTRRAAEILSLSQPAISRALGRLREHFNDELFVRSRYGLKPTAKAIELKVGLLPAIESLEHALSPQDSFRPLQLEGTITVAMNGFIANAYSAMLCKNMLEQAPNLQLNVVSWDNQTADKLLSGEIDVGVNYFPLELTKQLYQKKIANDRFVLLCRKEHPLSGSKLDNVAPQTVDIASLVIPDWNEKQAFAIRAFESVGLAGQIKFRSSYLHSIVEMVEQSDLIFPCSELLSRRLSGRLSTIEVPSAADVPTGDLAVVVSRRLYRSPKYNWLREQVEASFKQAIN